MTWRRNLVRSFGIGLALAVFVAGCSRESLSGGSGAERRAIPGGRAGGLDEALLTAVHSVATEQPPAAIRPDPDTHIRILLRQYREEGSVIAQEIGRVEDYRALLGGASEDFSKAPQLTYDSTSLLAVQKVAEDVCEGLVAPTSRHSGWETILPAAPEETDANLKFLAQRLIGLPSNEIGSSVIAALDEILRLSLEEGEVTLRSYIPVCVALSIDAEALLL